MNPVATVPGNMEVKSCVTCIRTWNKEVHVLTSDPVADSISVSNCCGKGFEVGLNSILHKIQGCLGDSFSDKYSGKLPSPTDDSNTVHLQ